MLTEKLARWLSPELAAKADRLAYVEEVLREAAQYDAKQEQIFREQMTAIERLHYAYGVIPNGPSYKRGIKRPIDPAIAAMLKAGRAALEEKRT